MCLPAQAQAQLGLTSGSKNEARSTSKAGWQKMATEVKKMKQNREKQTLREKERKREKWV